MAAILFLLSITQVATAQKNVVTADLLLLSGLKSDVRDCALFMPSLGRETLEVASNLKKLGYSPQVVDDIKVEKSEFLDSNGHSVNEYHTVFGKRVGYYGKKTLLMNVTGYEIGRSKKKIFILKLQRLGMNEAAVATSSFIGIQNERNFSVKSFPKCQPR
jgi:hypothetical protein